MKIRKQRLEVLKQWYPDLKSEHDRVHKSCLASLGLEPFPTDDLPMEQIMGAAVIRRIGEIATQHPNIPGPLQLISVVYSQLQREITAPTEHGQRQLRYMVSHWITMRHGSGRGGAVATDDRSFSPSTPDIISVIDTNCRLSDWIQCNETVSQEGTIRNIDPTAVLNAPTAKVDGLIAVLNAFANVEREKAQRYREQTKANESEMLLLREKRTTTQTTTTGITNRKRKREDALTQDGPLMMGKRFSVSHSVLHRLWDGPDREQNMKVVFESVHNWFAARRKNVTKGPGPFGVLTKHMNGLPVVYAWPAGHKRAFEDTTHEDHLHAYVKQRLLPDFEVEDCRAPVPVDTTTDRPIAAIFDRKPVLATIPPELEPISVERQRADVEYLCRQLNVEVSQWPVVPMVDDCVPDSARTASALSRWNRISSHKLQRISQWLGDIGIGIHTVHPGLYALAFAMRRLDGWNWTMGHGYPKSRHSSPMMIACVQKLWCTFVGRYWRLEG